MSNTYEASPIHTRRSTNIASPEFKQCMRETADYLCDLFSASHPIIIPGSGTFAMEAVARQYATDQNCLIVSSGFFGDRWERIFTQGKISPHVETLKASSGQGTAPVQPIPIDALTAHIQDRQPHFIFLSHVDTSTGLQLSDDYISQVSAATDAVVVVDGIASGCQWTNMKNLGIDILVTAPQKGLSAQPGHGIILLNDRAEKLLEDTQSTSFALDLQKWNNVMQEYRTGGFAYHSTLPTESILSLRQSLEEIFSYGPQRMEEDQVEVGRSIRGMLTQKGLQSVAILGYRSPSVLVHYVNNPKEVVAKFNEQGVRVAGALPFTLEEDTNKSFRIGAFGIDKLEEKEETLSLLKETIEKVF